MMWGIVTEKTAPMDLLNTGLPQTFNLKKYSITVSKAKCNELREENGIYLLRA